MDDGDFDALTRSVGARATRRALVRVLTGSVLGGLVAHLGLAAMAAGEPKQRKGKKGKKKKKPVLRTPCYLTDCDERGGRCCADGKCAVAGSCCPGEKRCVGYTECFAQDDCCPNAIPPLCDECDNVVCQNGSLVCRPKSNCCPAESTYCAGTPPDWYEWLPDGCCPVDHYFVDPRHGDYVCSSPVGTSNLWAVCDMASRGARSERR